MTPYYAHTDYKPIPMAMVCRKPFGTPNNSNVYVPQNVAWLSAIKNAKSSVFIQTPTLNAVPLVPAIIAACERGIQVTCFICIGYNDAGELLPGQGGTNEMISHKLYTSLSESGKKNLHYFWYTGKDMDKPINAKHKTRDCHIKLMIVDEHIGIQGNGNQDTQSWCHSQEINLMIDSETVCKEWLDQIERNQNTRAYGKLSQEDGIWRDKEGNEVEGSIGIDPGRFSWAKGIVGAVQRVRGAGGF
jgi:phosphatidylserine/phosphatidylglycerophosphate/cardiolipin synthase-like enzyme